MIKMFVTTTTTTTTNSTPSRSIAPLFTNRFEPLRASLSGATLEEVALYLHTEAEFLALQKPAHTFLARIFWNTVLTPVLSAYRDVVARERELVEVEQIRNEIRKNIDNARTQQNTTPDTLLQYGRDYDSWTHTLEMRRSAANHAHSRLNALLNVHTSNENQIQHIQS